MIVGLLIGGILVGQSLIQTAIRNKFISQLEQLDISINLFKSKYKYLPGDSPFHSPVGDGDGKLEGSVTNSVDDTFDEYYDYELASIYPHLQQNGFMASHSAFSSDTSSGITAEIHAPEIPYKSSQSPGLILLTYDTRTVLGKTWEYYYNVCAIMPNYGSADFASTRLSVFTPFEAAEIDKKIDDGLTGDQNNPALYTPAWTYRGSVAANNWMSDSGQGAYGDCASSDDGNLYNVSSKTKFCCLMIRPQFNN